MNNKSLFFLGGVISFSFYIFICVIFIYYVASPKTKVYTIKSKETVIELDVITKISDKKRIEKKEDKKTAKNIEKLIKRSTSRSNEKKPDLKSLFGKVKTKSENVVKKEINNVSKSLDPSRFKSKFEKQKKSSNIKIDKLFNDKQTTTNQRRKTSSKNEQSDDKYVNLIASMLDQWNPTLSEIELKARVKVSISPRGEFSYNFVQFSSNLSFNASLKAFLDEQTSIIYPIPPKGKTYTQIVNFTSKE